MHDFFSESDVMPSNISLYSCNKFNKHNKVTPSALSAFDHMTNCYGL